MIYKQDGKPFTYTHVCKEDRKGKKMTAEELHEFAVESLIDSYRNCDYRISRYVNGEGADFLCQSMGGKSSFKYGKDSYPLVNVLVVVGDCSEYDYSKIDTTWLQQQYHAKGELSHVVFAETYCVSDEFEREDTICGEKYWIKFTSFCVSTGSDGIEQGKPLSNVELAAKYCEALQKKDASIVAPYLDKDFHYSSDWVFDELPSRKEFLEYFAGKLSCIKDGQYSFQVGRKRQTGDVAIIVDEGNDVDMIRIATSNGYLAVASMETYDKDYLPFDVEDELYQCHGDHIDAIIPSQTFVNEVLPKVLQEGKMDKRVLGYVTSDSMDSVYTHVFGLSFGDGTMRMYGLLAANHHENNNEFVSVYPWLEGSTLQVQIDKVIEWDNQLEATIKCSLGDTTLAFFALDYFNHKDLYKVGSILPIDMAALGMRVEEADRGFTFEGQKAIDWLTKIGEKPSFDKDGNVEPVKFNTEHLVSYFVTDSKCPDEGEFQSPVQALDSASLLGVDFHKAQIMIHRTADDEEYSVPLYYRKDMLPDVKQDDPIRGWLWLTGCVNQTYTDEHADSAHDSLGNKAKEFEAFMDGCNFEHFDDIGFVAEYFSLLKISEDYVLDAFLRGDEYGWVMQAYCHRKLDEIQDYIPYKKNLFRKDILVPYEETWNIEGKISIEAAATVPPALNYFSVPFTEEGVLEAWLLDNAYEFMPRGWHACYGFKKFFFEADDIFSFLSEQENEGLRDKLRCFLATCKKEDLEFEVEMMEGKAEIAYTYFNRWQGLVRSRIEVTPKGDSVVFGEPHVKLLVHYECGIRF